MPKISASRAGDVYEEAGAIRDVVQNHMFQVLANLAMEPPSGSDSESVRDEKVKVLRAIAPLDAHNVVRGQFRGYRNEPGVAPPLARRNFCRIAPADQIVRWDGVPFFIRAGKCLPVTCTEVFVELRRRPSSTPPPHRPKSFPLSVESRYRAGAGDDGHGFRQEMVGRPAELRAIHHPEGDEMDAYERLLGDAMWRRSNALLAPGLRRGGVADVNSSGRESDDCLRLRTGNMGPGEVERMVAPPAAAQSGRHPAAAGLAGLAPR